MQAPAVRIRRRCHTSTNFDCNQLQSSTIAARSRHFEGTSQGLGPIRRSSAGSAAAAVTEAGRQRGRAATLAGVPKTTEDPDHANPARQAGLQHAQRGTRNSADRTRSHIGPTMAPPKGKKERPAV
jgi:hypothetical protein